jgi:hypothetical protein
MGLWRALRGLRFDLGCSWWREPRREEVLHFVGGAFGGGVGLLHCIG